MMFASDDGTPDEAASFENFDVLGNGRLRDGDVGRDRTRRAHTARQLLDDVPTDGIGQRREDPVEGCRLLNHSVIG
jgi:hypothetical protein